MCSGTGIGGTVVVIIYWENRIKWFPLYHLFAGITVIFFSFFSWALMRLWDFLGLAQIGTQNDGRTNCCHCFLFDHLPISMYYYTLDSTVSINN
jgi:hypothetical protein